MMRVACPAPSPGAQIAALELPVVLDDVVTGPDELRPDDDVVMLVDESVMDDDVVTGPDELRPDDDVVMLVDESVMDDDVVTGPDELAGLLSEELAVMLVDDDVPPDELEELFLSWHSPLVQVWLSAQSASMLHS